MQENDKKPKYTAVVVAAGNGSRMRNGIKKQFIHINGKPVVAYCLSAFQKNENIDDIVLVVPKDYIEDSLAMCMRYDFNKVRNIVEGSDRRFKSVYNGLKAAPDDTDYVLIHDGVRPMISQDLIDRCCKYVLLTRACIAAVPVADTIKRSSSHGFVVNTVDRDGLWNIQTPQTFSYPLVLEAYESLNKTLEDYGSDDSKITDDSIVVENMTDCRVRIIEGDPKNIKITTPSDLTIAEAFLSRTE